MLTAATPSVSLSYNLVRGLVDYHKHSFVTSGLFLGMLPVQRTALGGTFAHSTDEIIAFVQSLDAERPLRMVISVVEPEELNGNRFVGFTVASPDDWKAQGIQHCLLEMRDFQAHVDTGAALEALVRAKGCIDGGGAVYIHCKAGRSRSAMICAVYLAAYVSNPETMHLYSLDEAVLLLQRQRKQVSLDADKLVKAGELLLQLQARLQPPPANTATDAG